MAHQFKTSTYHRFGQPGEPNFKLQSASTELTLRQPTNDDIPTLIEILGNKANTEFDKSVSDVTQEKLETIARKWTTITQPLTYLNFLVLRNEQPLGISGFGWIGPVSEHQPKHDQSQAAAVGVMLQPFARGNGYAYEALRMVFDYGLRELGLVEIRVGSHSSNVSMKMLMEHKFGLKPETLAADMVDGFGNDLLWIIRKEWLDPANQHVN